MKLLKITYILLLPLMALSLGSCSTQNLFSGSQNLGDKDNLMDYRMESYEYVIQPGDKISLSVWGHDDLSVGSVFGIYNSNEVYGKWVLVSNSGEVQLPKIGQFAIGGMTTVEASHKLTEVYSEYIVDPIIVVKVMNMQATVLGGVNSPGNFILEEERTTLVELLGMAGGFDFYSDRSEIKLIRGRKSKMKEYYIDLTKMEEYEFNNIIIIPEDIVYVPTKNSKTVDRRSTTLIAFATALSAVAVFVTILR